MRALSLWQPWASLVVLGAKQIETRHWRPPASLVGETIAIHAALTTLHVGLARHGAYARGLGGHDIPLGAIVGTARVAAVDTIDATLIARLARERPDELELGNYEHGRVAWHLDDPVAFERPVPFRGRQGVFVVPGELVEEPRTVHPDQGTLL